MLILVVSLLYSLFAFPASAIATNEYDFPNFSVASGSFTGGSQYATCLICGGLATFGMTPFSVDNLPHTTNGSYILPNGTTVLVTEDVDEYMNGILDFRTGEIE